jgi:RHS repeat-associated protein
MTVGGQSAVSYTYDNGDRLTQITQGANSVSMGYDAANRRTSLTLPNGVVTEYGYDAASQLTGLTYKKGGNVLGNLTYDYSLNGQVIKVGGSFARTGLPQAVSTASYNDANQQTAFAGQTLTYDNNGNLTSDGANTYTWDARNRLASISGPGLSASFQYDTFGRRVSKSVNGASTSFLYDHANIVGEQSSGGSATLMVGLGMDEVFARADSSGASNLLRDALGSVIAEGDAAGVIQTSYSYEGFGRASVSGAPSGNAHRFTSREDDQTGLYYYRARYYSPQLQRFISEDPAGFVDGYNLYAYVQNDPVNRTDPTGRFAIGLPLMVWLGRLALLAALAAYIARNPPKPIPCPLPIPRLEPYQPPIPPVVREAFCPLKEKVGRLCVYQCSDGYSWVEEVESKADPCPPVRPRPRGSFQ